MAEFLEKEDISAKQKSLLYIDILNYGVNIFPLRMSWKVSRAFKILKDFADAARASGYELKVFIDDSTPSDETAQKWRSRRTQEVLKGERNMPLGMSRMIGDIFKILGVPVIYSDGNLGNDDNLAAHAEEDGAAVLSGDKDFFRYMGSHFKVYSEYDIRRGRLYLKERHASDIRNPSRPLILPMKPETVKHNPSHITDGVYMRGTPTPLVRALNIDLHSMLTPLRRACFVKLGIQGPITEVWPYWDAANECVAWHEEQDVTPTSTPEMMALLLSPDAALDHFFPGLNSNLIPRGIDKRDWIKHVFCIRSLIYEFCATEERPLVMLWLEYENRQRANTAGGENGGGGSRGQGRGQQDGRGGRGDSSGQWQRNVGDRNGSRGGSTAGGRGGYSGAGRGRGRSGSDVRLVGRGGRGSEDRW